MLSLKEKISIAVNNRDRIISALSKVVTDDQRPIIQSHLDAIGALVDNHFKATDVDPLIRVMALQCLVDSYLAAAIDDVPPSAMNSEGQN